MLQLKNLNIRTAVFNILAASKVGYSYLHNRSLSGKALLEALAGEQR